MASFDVTKLYDSLMKHYGLYELDHDSDEYAAAMKDLTAIWTLVAEATKGEINTAERKSGWVVYRVGDRDPTICSNDQVDSGVEGPTCDESDPAGTGYRCTWHEDHDHPQHIATDCQKILAVWDV